MWPALEGPGLTPTCAHECPKDHRYIERSRPELMKDELAKALLDGLYGKHTHPDPVDAVRGLTYDTASQRVSEKVHSSLDLLYHLVFWQDLCLEAARGEKDVKWPEAAGEDWPQPGSQIEWDVLVKRFRKGLKEGERIVAEVDLVMPLPAWRNIPMLRAMIVLAQHNSYHLGQIVTNRIAQGTWPPPKPE
ncbi:MAG: DinB family protein [Candidatus Thorarchaeota archaeon]|nr:MAG: DinB family protein [Candidatus Thorarchaeota archaeon]